MPKALSDISGIRFSNEINRVNYALFADAFGPSGARPETLRNLGAIALTQSYRRIEAGSEVQVWMRGVQSDDPASPEQLGMLEATGDPILVRTEVGEGSILYFAGGLGKMFADLGHADYAALLSAMTQAGAKTASALLTDAPSCVDVTLARWSRGVAVHLVNGAGPAPLDVTAALGPIELDLEWKGGAKVTLRTPEDKTQKLAFKNRGARIIVSVPILNAYALVVVETD